MKERVRKPDNALLEVRAGSLLLTVHVVRWQVYLYIMVNSWELENGRWKKLLAEYQSPLAAGVHLLHMEWRKLELDLSFSARMRVDETLKQAYQELGHQLEQRLNR